MFVVVSFISKNNSPAFSCRNDPVYLEAWILIYNLRSQGFQKVRKQIVVSSVGWTSVFWDTGEEYQFVLSSLWRELGCCQLYLERARLLSPLFFSLEERKIIAMSAFQNSCSKQFEKLSVRYYTEEKNNKKTNDSDMLYVTCDTSQVGRGKPSLTILAP